MMINLPVPFTQWGTHMSFFLGEIEHTHRLDIRNHTITMRCKNTQQYGNGILLLLHIYICVYHSLSTNDSFMMRPCLSLLLYIMVCSHFCTRPVCKTSADFNKRLYYKVKDISYRPAVAFPRKWSPFCNL